MKFKYCRIQGKELAANTRTGKGIFSMLNQMVTDGVMDEEDVGLFKEIDSWFAEELPWPPQCRRQEKVICYFKVENTEMMMKMIQPLLWLLERYNHAYYVVYTNFPGEIVYEDEHLLVVNKPKGMVVHPAPGHFSGTLVNALMYHCRDDLSGINGELRPGIVHRIDRNTSGLLVVAKSDAAHAGLSEQIKDHSFTREYLAICYGNIKEDERTVDAPIGRHKTDRKKMCVTQLNSKPAVTHIKVLERYSGFTYILCRLETGRTHQIRVHLSSIGHPIAGDDVYGPSKVITELHGQCLHAYKLGFIHPVTGEYLEFTADPPESFVKFREKLRQSVS